MALGIAIVDRMAATLTFAGIGNIHGQIVGAEITRLLSCRGVVGGGFRSVRPETLKLNPGDLVTLFTDGVDERVVVSTAQASSCDNLQKFAATIIDEWGLEKDDVGAMIFRNR